MKKLLYLLAASTMLINISEAADMAVKTQPDTLVTYTGKQFYILFGTAIETDKATVSGINGNAFTGYAAGGKILAGFGYIWAARSGNWMALEAWAGFQNIGTTTGGNPVTPGSISAKGASFTERLLVGGDWISSTFQQITAGIPNLGVPTVPVLPPGAVGAHPYAFAALHQDQVGADYMLDNNKVWKVTAGAGLGVQAQWTPTTPGAVPVTMDIFAEYKFANQGITIGDTSNGSIASASFSGGAIAGVIFKH